MNQKYTQLLNLVNSGALDITFIDAPQRTVSSAFYRSMTHVHDLHHYEPTLKNDFEGVIDLFLNDYKRYKNDKSAPVKLVVKDSSKRLSKQKWEMIMPLVKDFIFIIREPNLQIHSFYKRVANDMFSGGLGQDVLTDAKIKEVSEQVDKFLLNGGEMHGNVYPGNYERTGWKNLNIHYDMLKEHLDQFPEKTVTILDGFLLRAQPKQVMSKILDKIGLKVTENLLDKVVSDWDDRSAKSITNYAESGSAYTKKAKTSSGYMPPLDETVKPEWFPEGTRKFILEQALPVYIKFLQSEKFLRPETLKNLEKTINLDFDKTFVSDKNPITIYALTATHNPSGHAEKKLQERILSGLKQYYGEYIEMFERIDELSANRARAKVISYNLDFQGVS